MNLLDVSLNKQNNLNTGLVQNNQQAEAKAAIYAHTLLKKAADTFEPIATIGLRAPDRPENSYIVNDPFYMAPVNFLKDIKENLVNIKNGMFGKSNDHDLGRMNDFAMRAGALGLAGYLFTRGKTSMSKAMEFIGFGSFFAAMTLWPKLFIQAPLKAMYGLDIHQRYVDNEGRKKMFFQDPQYIPWSLYTDEELSALGDRLGVPKNIHNRHEVIKKKAHKIALQGNTLWMFTAGFATPLLCALGCNGFEKLFNPPSEKTGFPRNLVYAVASTMEKRKLEKAENKVKNTAAITASKMKKYNPKVLNDLLALYKEQPITEDLVNAVAKELSHDNDVLLRDYVTKQIRELVKPQKPEISENYAKKFYDYAMKELAGTRVDYEYLRDKESLFKDLALKCQRVEDFKTKLMFNIDLAQPDNDPLFNAVARLADKFHEMNSPHVLTTQNIQQLKLLDEKLYEFSIKKHILDGYNSLYFNNAGGTIAANRWNNTANAFFKALGLNSKDIEFAKQGEDNAYRMVYKKLDELVKNDKAYEKAFKKVYTAVLDFDKTVLPDAPDGSSQGIKAVLEERYNVLFDDYAKTFEELGFGKIKERLVGSITKQGSLRDNVLDRISQRCSELRNGMYKFLQVLDFFKRAGETSQEGSKFARAYFNYSSINGMDMGSTKETLIKDIDQYKEALLRGTIADYTTKFGFRNPQVGLYNRMMKLMFNTDFADSTKSVLGMSNDAKSQIAQLGKTNFVDTFTKKVSDTLSNLGNFQYPHADKVMTVGVNGRVGHILERDSLAGPRIDRVVRETASQVYNTSKWFKMFGGATAVLVGVTLLAETFFGNIKTNDIYSKKDKK